MYKLSPSHVITWIDIPIQEDVTQEEVSFMILEHEALHRREILTVKLLWQHHGHQDSTWEHELEIMERFPQLFM